MLRSPEVIMATWRAFAAQGEELSEHVVRDALESLDPVWDKLFPAEQARIVQLLVKRVDVAVDAIDIQLRPNGLVELVEDLNPVNRRSAA